MQNGAVAAVYDRRFGAHKAPLQMQEVNKTGNPNDGRVSSSTKTAPEAIGPALRPTSDVLRNLLYHGSTAPTQQ
jgi:hypothetical protein